MSVAAVEPVKKRRDPKTGAMYAQENGRWRKVEEIDRAYPHEHAARVESPDSFEPESFRRKTISDGISLILAKRKGGDGAMEKQAYRFAKDKFTAEQAKAWLKEHDVTFKTFEPAANEQEAARSVPSGRSDVIRKAAVNISTWRASDNSIEAVICTDSPCYSTEVKTGKSVKEVWLMSGLEFDPHVRVLNDHKRDDVRQVLGSAGEFRTAEHDAAARLFLSAAEPAICTKVSEGHIRDVSVGGERREVLTIAPGQSKEIGGQLFTADRSEPLNIVTRLRVYEVSLTAVGSDPGAVTRSLSLANRSQKMTKSMRKFLTRSTGMDPKATDEDSQKHFDGLHPEVQKACRAFSDAETEEEEAAEEEEESKKNKAEEADRKKKSEEEEAARAAAVRSGNVTDADAIRKAALAEGAEIERKRVARLTQLGEDLPAEILRKAIDEKWDVERAAPVFQQALRDRTNGVGPFIQSRSFDKDLTQDVLGTALVIRSMSRLDSKDTGATFASNPTNLIGRYRPDEMTRGGIGDWQPDFPTRELSDVQRAQNDQLLNRAERFRNLSMVDICRHCCRLDGISVPDYASPSQIVGAAMGAVTRAGGSPSGGSFGAIFTTNFNALFLAGYLEAADSTMGWCSEGDAPNFLPGELATVGKMGSLTLDGKSPADHLAYGDWNEKIQVSRFSGMFEVDEKDLINDRFGALRSNSPQEIGLAARRVRPNLIYSLLMGNYVVGTSRGPTLNQDGLPLFHATHGNFLTAANNDLYTESTGAVGVAGLQKALPAIGSQRLNGVPLNLTPRFALISRYLDMGIRVALFSTQRIVASGAGSTLNPLQMFNIEPRADSRMDDVGSVDPLNNNKAVVGLKYHYILACRPGEEGAKTVHVNYLLGSGRAPQIRSYVLGGPGAPGRWGIGWDVKLDIGAAVEDYRGLYYAESST